MGIVSRIRQIFSKAGTIGVGGLMPSGFIYSNGTLASNETIFSAISMLSGAIASAPITLQKDYHQIKPIDSDIAWLLEFGANPNMTMFEFIRGLETLRNSTGAGYAIKELKTNGNISALWLMRTENVMPMIERDSRELFYRVRDDVTGETDYIHHSNIISVGHISGDGITPINPIDVLRSSLNYDKEVKEFSVDQMKNGLRANIAIKVQGMMNEKQFEEYNEMLRRFMKSGVLYLDNGKTIQELKGSNVIDPKVFEVENITIARVARVFNIPLEKFLPDKASFSSAEQSDLNYLRDTILPMARMYEQEFSKKLLSEQERAEGMRIRFSLNGFARADMKTRGEFYMKGARTGWFSVNDIRMLEDMPPIEGGDEHFISKDLIPLKKSNS